MNELEPHPPFLLSSLFSLSLSSSTFRTSLNPHSLRVCAHLCEQRIHTERPEFATDCARQKLIPRPPPSYTISLGKCSRSRAVMGLGKMFSLQLFSNIYHHRILYNFIFLGIYLFFFYILYIHTQLKLYYIFHAFKNSGARRKIYSFRNGTIYIYRVVYRRCIKVESICAPRLPIHINRLQSCCEHLLY